MNIIRYEELAINAFPALLTEMFDGWILRYSKGYTYRGNSINPLYLSTLELEEKITKCEEKYFSKALPCVFKMTDAVPQNLDELLELRGYKVCKEADIMTMPLRAGNQEELAGVSCSDKITEAWLDEFVVLNGTSEEPMKSIAKDILGHIGNEVICVAIYEEEHMVACGLGVYEEGKIGLYDIRVHEKVRRKGYGTQICRKIINEGVKLGANEAYLQVMTTNEIAKAMYKKIGFKKNYTYWYRVLTKAHHKTIND